MPDKTNDLHLLREGDRIIAIVGICKNAGKTSVLNALLHQYPDIRWAVLSTGRDGEEKDTVFGITKPRVMVGKGTLLCLDTRALNDHGAAIKIIRKLPWKAGTRQLWLAEALLPLETEIIGPPEVTQQAECARLMLELGARKVMIDGSIDRKSIALSPWVDSLILVAGASFGNMQLLCNELERIELLTRIPVPDTTRLPKTLNPDHLCLLQGKRWQDTGLKSLLGNDGRFGEILRAAEGTRVIYVPGALTDRSLAPLRSYLQDEGRVLLLRHPYHFKTGKDEVRRLLQRHQIMAIHPLRINAIALNSWAVDGQHIDASRLREEIGKRFWETTVFDIYAPEGRHG